jgi:two-component system, cell cycle sensor histidine kinase and response regulator CckA
MGEPGWTMEHVALAAAEFGAWDFDVASGRVSFSERVAEFFGMPRDRLTGTYDDFISRLHPGDRAGIDAAVQRAMREGPDEIRLESRIDGATPERWLAGYGRVFRDASGAAVRVAGILRDCSERKRAEREEGERGRLMQAALDASVFAVTVLDPAGRITYANQLAASLLGLAPSAVEGRSYDAPQWKHTSIDGGPWPDEKQPFVRVMATGEPVFGVEHAIERPDGRRTALRINGVPVKDANGAIRLAVFSFEDITERLAMEASVRQSHKMEAVGRLAGGVAHDFNNLLTVISAHCESLALGLGEHEPMRQSLEEVLDAARRGAALTRQLLTFSRKQVIKPEVLSVDEALGNATRLLRRLIGEDVEMSVVPGAPGACVRMDPSQFEQVLVNLVVNARDAMPDGGKLSVSTDLLPVAEAAARRPGVRPVAYVRLSVADTGAGIPADVLPHIFEPFFTTKEHGRGTGLGLSIVYGIAGQNGGFVRVASPAGEGTRFEVCLPLTAALPEAAPAGDRVTAGVQGASVLIVEDEPGVLLVTERLLRAEGFRVTTAAHPRVALEKVRDGLEADLLLTDVVMPGMNGRQLYTELLALRPGLRVVYMSGHAQEILSEEGVGDAGAAFVQKPFALSALLEVVRRTLRAD